MNIPYPIRVAATELAKTFQLVAEGPLPTVIILGRDDSGRVIVLVGYTGDELVRLMQVEAFLVERGDTITQRSQFVAGKTVLIYRMKAR